MDFENCLNRFRRHLRRGPRSRRPEMFQGRPRIERLEDRMVPSTLDVSFGTAHYLGSLGAANNVTLTQRIVGLATPPPPSSTIPIPIFHVETIITDAAEKISVTGADASAFTGSGTNQVTTFEPLKSLLVDLQGGNDVVNVQAINYATSVRHIGPGVDTVNVGEAGSLQGIQASLGVEDAGNGSLTHLNVDDSADTASHSNVVLFGGQINNLAPASIAYLPLNSSDTVTVSGGSGNNNYLVQGPLVSTTLNTGTGNNHVNAIQIGSPLTIRGHGGNDTVNVSALDQGSQGAVTVSNTTNSTALVVDDTGDHAPRTVTIGANSVQFDFVGPPVPFLAAPIQFLSGVKSVTVDGGNNDTFLAQTQSSTTPVFISGGSGTNTLVSGNGFNDWTITGLNKGTLHNVTFANIQNLRGGSASSGDTFHFNDQAGVTGSIQGAGSPLQPATLDYSKYTTPVTVNLKTNSALAGGIKTSIFNIQNVLGGSGNNILVGNGNNHLKGGSGRDLLISGGGNGTLQAGSGEAILIGAHYLFDTNLTALDAILAEWSRPISYTQRVHDLEFGGGVNGPFVLNSSTVSAQPGTTTLTSGAGLDFLILDSGDTLTNPLRPGEVALKV